MSTNSNMSELQTVKQRFGIIGNSPAIEGALDTAIKVAPTDLTVLITGESGVGKEFFPQVIHAYSSRKHNKYVAVNCGAIPDGTIDSELFGHEKGSFTGAVEARKGYFEEADGGTLFLDEVGELPIQTQVRLLRVLQSGEYIRVGSSQVRKTNVRVIAATNNDLQRQISEGKFREDLFYRLNTVPIAVPALRERKEDIFILFRKFSADVAIQYHMPTITLTEEARAMLEQFYWKGNVRQLKNVAEQISALESTRVITPEVLAKYLPMESSAPSCTGVGYNPGYSSERDLMFKFLFDIKSNLMELKTAVAELRSAIVSGAASRHDVAGLISDSIYQDEYAESAVVVDSPAKEITKADVQRDMITKALKRHQGNRRAAARELLMSERTLYRKIKELGIQE